MIKMTLIIVALLILGVLAFAATRPDEYTVSRSQLINAPADKLHAIINTPREFEKWSPYFAKVIGVFINMDKMIGGDFAVGLDKLKALAEKG